MVHKVTKSQKKTITFPHSHSFTFIWLKKSIFKSSWPFNRGIKQNKITLGTARSWLQPLNRGGRWIEFLLQCIAVNFSGTLVPGHQIKVCRWIEVRLYLITRTRVQVLNYMKRRLIWVDAARKMWQLNPRLGCIKYFWVLPKHSNISLWLCKHQMPAFLISLFKKKKKKTQQAAV